MSAAVNSSQEPVEVDALVVGAGAAGMAAALVSAIEGLDVLLCEKSAQVGGTTATSAGTVWIPGTRHSRQAGFTHAIAEARQYLDAVIGEAPDNRREIYLQTGPEVVDYLDRHSEVKFAPYLRHPDYLPNRPAATVGGRPLAPLPFDGRRLAADFDLVRPPIGEFMALGGMMIGRDDIEPLARPFASLTALRAAASLLWRHARDRLRYRRGTSLLMGNALVARLFYSLRRNGVPVWLNASLQELTVAAGRVCGAVLMVNGNPRRVTARRGIVLATGGFGGSVERLNDYVRPPLAHAVAFAGAAGDGIRLARTVGAFLEDDHASPAFWTPVSETAWLDGGCGAFPHLSLDRAKPGLVAVNAAGRRFVDEAVSCTSSSSACIARTRACPASQLGSSVTVNSSTNTGSAASRRGGAACVASSRVAILSRRPRSRRWPARLAWTQRVCARRCNNTIALPRPART